MSLAVPKVLSSLPNSRLVCVAVALQLSNHLGDVEPFVRQLAASISERFSTTWGQRNPLDPFGGQIADGPIISIGA